MKKFFYIIPALLVMLTSCDGFFKLDNHESYNASINGKFIDAATGETIPFEPSNSSASILVYELENADGHKWDGEAAQSWAVKFDGTYRNNLIFAGKYRFDFSKLPVYEASQTQIVDLKRGANDGIDFTCTPYCRVEVTNIAIEGPNDDRYHITCQVEAGDVTKTPTISSVRAYLHTDKFVCTATNKVGTNKKDTYIAKSDVNSGDTVELYIQKGTYSSVFQYDRPYYIRVAATAKPAGENTSSLPNLSKVYKTYRDANGEFKWEEVTF